jgi:integrase
MDLRKIFPADLFGDHQLVAVYLYFLTEVQSVVTYQRQNGMITELQPFEVICKWSRVTEDLALPQNEIIEKLNTLHEMQRIILVSLQDLYVRIRYLNLRFPINEVAEKTGEDGKIINISYQRWMEIDTECVKNHWSQNYLEIVTTSFERFEQIVGKRPLCDVTGREYDDLVNMLKTLPNRKGGKLMTSTINDYTAAIKASFRRAVKDGYLDKDPFKGKKRLPQPKILPVIFNGEDVELLRRMPCPEWLKLIIDYALLTACRLGEIANVRFEDLDEKTNEIQIIAHDGDKPKGGRERNVPQNRDLRALIRRAREFQLEHGIESDFVFVDEKGNRLKNDRISKKFKECIEECGMDDGLNFHALRRTAATNMRDQRFPEHVTQRILGHTTPSSTHRYLGVTNEAMHENMQKIGLSNFSRTGQKSNVAGGGQFPYIDPAVETPNSTLNTSHSTFEDDRSVSGEGIGEFDSF